eukprot:1395210-Amorphochlora_amoeboformis.AAC.1
MFERQSGDNDHVTPGHVSTDLFDFSNFDTPLPPGDIVVAADVLYYEPTAKVATSNPNDNSNNLS